MKILMIGLGSIGQRHLRNIKKLYGNEHEISAYRVRRSQLTFSDNMTIRENINLEKEYNLKVFSDLDIALAERPDIVFVTNITAKHMECAIKAAKAGCDIFLEKPISDTMEGVEELQNIALRGGNIIYVGYQNRFHPCISDIKSFLKTNKIGNIISVHNEFSERLTTMHTYEDYSTTYMANKNMGGGPILNLQIHALDYLQWIFGVPESVCSLSGYNGDIKIDVEDHASSLYVVRLNNGSRLPIYSYTDFYQYPPVHFLKIVGENGRIEADFNKAVTKLIYDGTIDSEIAHNDFSRNDMFINELKDFIYCVSERKVPDSNLEEGITGLKMALAAKKSGEENRVVRLEEII